MSKCDQGKKVLIALDGMSKNLQSLREVILDGVEDVKPGEGERKEGSIREKAEIIADKIFWMPPDERLGHRTALIEALVREEVEACAEIANTESAGIGVLGSTPRSRISLKIQARLDR